MSIVSELVLRTGGFQAGVKSAGSALNGLGRSAMSLKGVLLGAFAAMTTGAAAVGLKDAFDVGGALKELSSRTGAAVGDLAVLQQAFRSAGLEAEDVGPIVSKMNRAILAAASGGKTDSFDRIGLSFAKLKNLSTTDRLKAIGAGIDSLHDPSVRAATAMDLLGKTGDKMLDLFADSGAMSDAAKKIGGSAQLLERNAMIFDSISDNLKASGVKLQQFFVGMAAAAAPAIAPLLDKIMNMDFSSWGTKVGKVFGTIVTLFSSGILSDLLADGFMYGVTVLINGVLGGLNGAMRVVADSLGGAAYLFVQYLAIPTQPDFWKGVGNSLASAAQTFAAIMLEGVQKTLEAMSRIRGLGSLKGAASSVGDTAKNFRDGAGASANNATGNATAILARLGDEIKTVLNPAKSFAEGKDAMPQLENPYGDSMDNSLKRFRSLVDKQQKDADALNAQTRPDRGEGDDQIKAADKMKLGPVAAQTLTKIGGGGVAVGGGGSSPELAEARRQTKLLGDISKTLSRGTVETTKKTKDAEAVFQ